VTIVFNSSSNFYFRNVVGRQTAKYYWAVINILANGLFLNDIHPVFLLTLPPFAMIVLCCLEALYLKGSWCVLAAVILALWQRSRRLFARILSALIDG